MLPTSLSAKRRSTLPASPMLHRQASLRASCALGALIALSLLLLYRRQSSYSGGRPTGYSPGILDHIGNRTLGFEKILVVGLPARTDRRDTMVLQAALSDLDIQFIDGVRGEDIPDSAIPSSRGHERLPPGSVGSWRGHMNAIREIVYKNISSALILEDDTDWDVRIRQQMRRLALSTQALTQPLEDFPGQYADPTYPSPSSEDAGPEIPFDQLPKTTPPTFSPYGDSWDLLWVGHCGMQMPPPDHRGISRGRVIQKDDDTVVEKRYMYSFASPFTLVDVYPEHTRAVHHVQEGVCSLGYAVSQKGARRLLHEVGLKDMSDPFDILLGFYCEGAKGRRKHMCLATQPGLFQHHRRAGPDRAQSDIGDHGDGYREHSETDMVRWSARLNADVLMEGGSVFHDQRPDSDVQ